MAGRITVLHTNLIRSLGTNSPVTLEMMHHVGHDIYEEIYRTAPRTYKHAYSYRDHFRIWETRKSAGEGYRVYVVAERFQWRFIEFGWKEWRDEKPRGGLFIMTNALLKQRKG